MKKSFIIIEVLIAIFIMFLAIVIVATGYKEKNMFDNKSKLYQKIYINIKNIVNWLDSQNIKILSNNFVLYKIVKINNMKIKIFLKLLEKKSKFNITMNNSQILPSKNNDIYFLYKVKLEVYYLNYKKVYYYDLTKWIEK